jgi:hypothetical protein
VKRFRGVAHAHSKHSFDGKIGLGRLRELLISRGYSFLLLTEHDSDGLREDYDSFVGECLKYSDDDFIIIPGIEFEYPDYVHILGIGLFSHPGNHDISQQIISIKEAGGIAALAHANTCKSVPYDELLNIDCIEVWNSRYHERFAPRERSLQILEDIRVKVGKDIPLIAGQDLHSEKELKSLKIEILLVRLEWKPIKERIIKGEFTVSNSFYRLSGLEKPTNIKSALFRLTNQAYDYGHKLKTLNSS